MASSSTSLTSKAVSLIHEQKVLERPILQVREILTAPKKGNIKVRLSDGVDFMEGMIPHAGVEELNTIILTKYTTNKQGATVRILADEIEVLHNVPKTLVGMPRNISTLPNAPQCGDVPPPYPSAIFSTPSPPTASPEIKIASALSDIKMTPSSSSSTSKAVGDKGVAAIPYVSIASLVPGETRTKFIKARVISRTDVKPFRNGNGKQFSADFVDEKGGQLKGTFFNGEADTWDSTIRRSEVYRITGFTLKAANKMYSKPGTQWEMSIDGETTFVHLSDTIVTPLPTFNFTKLVDIQKCKEKDSIDVVGIISEVKDYQVTVKEGKETCRRVITISDETNYSIDMTVWGKEYKDLFEIGNCKHKILAVKDCSVSYFSGRVSLNNGMVYLDCTEKDVPSIAPTVAWFKDIDPFEFKTTKVATLQGINTGEVSMNGIKRTVDELKNLKLEKDKTVYSIVYGNVTKFDHESKSTTTTGPAWYNMMCPKPDCKKKLTAQNRCESCNKTHPTGIPKYKFRVEVSDHTNALQATAYGDQAQKLLGGAPVEKLIELNTDKTRAEFNSIFCEKNTGKPHNFKIQSKGGIHNEKPVVWHTIVECVATSSS